LSKFSNLFEEPGVDFLLVRTDWAERHRLLLLKLHGQLEVHIELLLWSNYNRVGVWEQLL